MVEDLAASAFAEAESGLRVSARMVKESFEEEARMVVMSFLPCFPVPPSTRRGLGAVIVSRLGFQVKTLCSVKLHWTCAALSFIYIISTWQCCSHG